MKTFCGGRRLWLMCCVAGLASVRGGAASKTVPAPEPAMSYQQELRAAEEARRADPNWKPFLDEVQAIAVGLSPGGGSVHNYCLDRAGNLLVCAGGKFMRVKDTRTRRTETVNEPPEIRVYSPGGERLKTWSLPCQLQAICVSPEGQVFAGGSGRILRLDAEGRVVASVETPVAHAPVVISKEIEQMLREQNRLNPGELQKMKETLERRRADVPGIAATDRDVFVVCSAPSEFSYRVYRFDPDLKNPQLILEKLRGCCGQMDIRARDGKLWVAHNGRHRVEIYDRDGTLLQKFGKAGRIKPQDFGGCCEPKNLGFAPNGDVLAAESGPPSCVKRFSPDGRFLGVLAIAREMTGDCVRMSVACSPEGERIYLLDTTKDVIRVFEKKN